MSLYRIDSSLEVNLDKVIYVYLRASYYCHEKKRQIPHKWEMKLVCGTIFDLTEDPKLGKINDTI